MERLLDQLRRTARDRRSWCETCLGTDAPNRDSDGDGVTPTRLIVTPWHPLRLAEIGCKDRAGGTYRSQRIVTSPSDKTREVEQYVNDRIQALQQTYYANVGMIRSKLNFAHLLMETEIARNATVSSSDPFSEDDGQAHR